MLFADRPTASLVIANLAHAGWVEVSRNPADGRGRVVGVTVEGSAVLAGARALLAAEAAVFQPLAGLDAAERVQLLDLLTRVERRVADTESAVAITEEVDERE
jgi:DNA-binding MarR family transcriptional regulator